MKRKAKVKMSCTAIVYINESVNGDQEIEDVEDVLDIDEFEVVDIIQ